MSNGNCFYFTNILGSKFKGKDKQGNVYYLSFQLQIQMLEYSHDPLFIYFHKICYYTKTNIKDKLSVYPI